MIVKVFLLFVLVSVIAVSQVNSQLANSNMYLLSNINSHSALGPYSAVWGYKAPDGREYAILGSYDGTSFVDITNPANIYEVDFVPTTNQASSSNQWREMKTYSHYAYIVSEVANSGVQIVDLQYLPDSVRYVKKFVPAGHTSTHSISQSGPYLYLNGCNSTFGSGVTVLDISVDPENPVKRGGYNASYIHDCRVVNDTIYAANINNSRVSIINATNKNSLSLITSFQNLPNSGPHNTALTVDGKHLLVTDEIGTSPRLMKIWNVDDLGNITYVTNWQPTGITGSIVHNVEIYGYYALVAHYSAGIRLVDIANPGAPAEVAWYDSYPSNNGSSYNGCWGVYMFPSGKIIASDRQTGLYVLKTNFNVTVAIEGLYNSTANRLNKKDTVTVYLRNAKSPYAIVDSAKSTIDSVTLTGNFKMNYAPSGNYYVSIKHKNSLETWSKAGGESYDPMTFETYNFTNAYSQAFGSNMTQVDFIPVRFALFSGDVNQDGAIDGGDAVIVDNDASNFVSGNVITDLNGDYTVDGSDVSIVDNNASNYVSKIVP
jgi:choice-of-anchor B domain-containing protein